MIGLSGVYECTPGTIYRVDYLGMHTGKEDIGNKGTLEHR